MKKFLFLLFIAFTFNAFAQNQRLHVRQNAGGANDGSSWQNAFPDLQDALIAAQPGDSIWVAEGTYYPTSASDRTISFRVKSGVRLFGGFSGSETNLNERDWEAHPVILSGAIGSIFFVDNSLHIMYLESPDSNTVLDGLRFTKGVEDADTTDSGGAAIYVWAKDTLGTPVSAARIRNCHFQDNSSVWYGGAISIYSYGTDQTRFERCTFLQNDARFGGAINVSASEIQTEFVDCQFLSNTALEGGGAITIGSSLSGALFSGCYFEKNRTKDSGGSAVSHGGQSMMGKGVVFSGCDFVENVCEINGYPEGGAIFMTSWSGSDTLTVEHCDFKKNTGFEASGVYIKMSSANGSNFQFRHCRFEENGKLAVRVQCLGGCGDNSISSMVLDRCEILKNQGEAVAVEGQSPALQETQLRIDSCRFLDNSNGRVSFNISGVARLEVSNSIFNGSKNGEVLSAFVSQAFLTNCVIEANKGYWLFNWENGTTNVRNCLFRKNQTQDFMFAVNFGTLNAVNCNFDSNAVVSDYPFPFFVAEATIVNSIFTGNTGAAYVIPGYLNPHFHHCYFSAPLDDIPATLTLGDGILTGADPLFQNAATGNFHLQLCSPLVGSGDNNAVTGWLTDLDGMQRIQGGTVDIGIYENAAPSLAAAPEVEAPCPGEQTASIDFQPINGCEPYVVSWSSGAVSGQNLDGLSAGDYIFSITDARGSALIMPLTITEKPAPALAPVVTPVSCGDALGGSTSLVANGVAPFTFLWPDNSTDSVRTDLASGTYAVTITDSEGCVGIDTVAVATQGRLKAALKIDKITCPGFADGSLTVTPDNGLAPFRWLWGTGDTTASLSGLGPGIYHLTLTDALGCAIEWSIPLVEPDVDCDKGTTDVFPNPFSGYLMVQTEFVPDETSCWILCDARGQVMEKVALQDFQMRVVFPDLPQGIYFWQLWHRSALVRTGRVEKMNRD